jgi:hypothetical protein
VGSVLVCGCCGGMSHAARWCVYKEPPLQRAAGAAGQGSTMPQASESRESARHVPSPCVVVREDTLPVCSSARDVDGLMTGVGGGVEEEAARFRCLRERKQDLQLQQGRIEDARSCAEREKRRAREEWERQRKKELAERWVGQVQGGCGGGKEVVVGAKADDAWEAVRAADTRKRLGGLGFLDGATVFNLQRSFAVTPLSLSPPPR